MRYSAFISYSGAEDGKLAETLRRSLQKFAKPWYRFRARTIYTPATQLAPSDATASGIENAIKNSENFILLASPTCAKSAWVNKELTLWLQTSPSAMERVFIILLDGKIAWDSVRRDFDFAETTALPPALAGVFNNEPPYVDLRWATTAAEIADRPEFTEALATIIAAIAGGSIDGLYSEEARARRSRLRLLRYAFIAVAILGVFSTFLLLAALRQRSIARRAATAAEESLELSNRARHIADLSSNQAAMSRREAVVARDEAQMYADKLSALRKKYSSSPAPSESDSAVKELRNEVDQLQQQLDQYKTTTESKAKEAENYRSQLEAYRAQTDILRTQVANSVPKQEHLFGKKGKDALNRCREFLLEHLGVILLFAATSLAVLTLSTRIISILLQLDAWPLTVVAPAIYLTGIGRRKLYRAYRENLLARSDVVSAINLFQDIPYEASDVGAEKNQLLSSVIRSASKGNVIIVADGGRGKSTLSYAIANRVANATLTINSKRVEPVIIDGVDYAGDLAGAILSALKKGGVYANAGIVETQLSAGNLFIVFDGHSEIRESYSKDDKNGDLPTFIMRHPEMRVFMTSRSPLPPALKAALGEPTSYELLDLDDRTIEPFLTKYLSRRKEDVGRLVSELNEILPHVPRIPLMLRLVAAVFEENGTVPTERAGLFAEYTSVLFRPAVTNLQDSSGFQFALRHLVRYTFLASGGDRGLTITEGVMLLRPIKEILADFRISFLPVDLMNFFVHAGVYRRSGEHLRFFHDSFESYVGACALATEFRQKTYDMIGQCSNNLRLIESWDFLLEMLSSDEDRSKLREVLDNSVPQIPIERIVSVSAQEH
jgi:hypothetical protein